MGHVMTQITLKNIRDTFKAEEGLITEPEIRQATVDVLVDTGATTLIINKKLFQELGLGVMEKQEITFANDAKEICEKTDPVEIHWEDRKVAMSAIVVEEATEVLLGVLPLEGMDLMVDTVNQRLLGAHGDHSVYLAKSIHKK